MSEKAKVDPEKIIFARMIAALVDEGYFEEGDGREKYADTTRRMAKMRDRMPVDEEDILAAALRAVEVRDTVEASSLLNRIKELATEYPDQLETALRVFDELDNHMQDGKAPPFEWQGGRGENN